MGAIFGMPPGLPLSRTLLERLIGRDGDGSRGKERGRAVRPPPHVRHDLIENTLLHHHHGRGDPEDPAQDVDGHNGETHQLALVEFYSHSPGKLLNGPGPLWRRDRADQPRREGRWH
jgi:hypothetical protein